jgi:hypothetical protein
MNGYQDIVPKKAVEDTYQKIFLNIVCEQIIELLVSIFN